jgi:hypothetical protein
MPHDRATDTALPPPWVIDAIIRREAEPKPWQSALGKGDLAEIWLGSMRILVEILAGPSEAPDLPGGWRVVRAFSTYYPEGEIGTAAVSDITGALDRAAFDAALGTLRDARG